MTVLDIQRYMQQQPQAYEVEVLNIGEGRASENTECMRVRNAWDFVWKVMRFARRGYIIHLETNGHNPKSWLSALLCAAAGYLNGRRTIIAFGSGNLPAYLLQLSRWRKAVVKYVLASAGVVICRNDNMVQAIKRVSQRGEQIEIVPGFMGLHTRKLVDIPEHVRQFCREHTPLLGATVTLEPEYGASLAIQAIQRFRSRYPKVGLILLGIGSDGAEQLPEYAQAREHVLAAGAVEANAALSVMRQLHLFLRPTYFDGDSLSVREALALGVPVVASNTGLRPKGVILFETGQIEDLEKKLIYALDHRDDIIARQRSEADTDGGINQMMQIYRRFSMQ